MYTNTHINLISVGLIQACPNYPEDNYLFRGGGMFMIFSCLGVQILNQEILVTTTY